ncbi:MAG: hypothetical protein ACJ75H_13295 [Thermoanaerobaculia bacterium]
MKIRPPNRQTPGILSIGCAMVVFAALALVTPTGATTITPIFVDGNPSCTSLGYAFGFKIDPPNAGTYSIDGVNTVTVTTDGVSFDWSSTLGMDAVISKGGPNANVYIYDPPAEATSDTGLHSPINPNNDKPFGLSHIDFCFDYEVAVTKDAKTSFTRTYRWNLTKTVSPALWALFKGDSGTSMYTLGVEKTGFTDSAWAVEGTITIHNPAPVAATLTSVADSVSPAIAAAVDCGVTFPHSLASGGTLTCTYKSALPDGDDRLNTATVTTTGPVKSGSGKADVKFGDPTTVVNGKIKVIDSNGGTWEFSDTGSTSYQRTFTCNADQGVHNNTATIVQTGDTASASVAVQCSALEVTKTASTSLTRTWDWTIKKSADQTSLTLSPGQTFLVNYDVGLTTASSDGEWSAHGTIKVKNLSSARAATINSVADLAGAVAGTVSCGVAFPYLLAAGATLNCTYTADLPSAASRTNTGTATLQNYAYNPAGVGTPTGTTGFSGTAAIDFSGAAVLQVDECVDVKDSLQGTLGHLCADAAPGSFKYSRYIGPFASPGQCGDQLVKNTASFIAGDTGATGDSSWTVTATVVCQQGCTLTPGYWKTHSQRGPAPYDDTWAQILPSQQDTAFFLSGQTYYKVLWTAPQGNAYYILAHAYIATTLNVLNGASTPPEVLAAWNEATTLFQTYTPAQIGAQKGSQQPRKRFLELAGLLDMYNNGLIGPGHCSE